MIRINKSNDGPRKLVDGAALAQAHEAARLAEPNAGATKQTAFKFNRNIYGSATIKSALREAQHNKCCYCEGIFASQASGDVEHYRPKTRFRQAKGAPVEYPGYYWLAYTWSNLYYACEICNRIFKNDLFPLVDPTQRNRSGNDDRVEEPEILDPGGPEDPRDHIRFNGEGVFGVTDIGRKTIQVLGLDREELTTDRLRRLKHLHALKCLADFRPEGLNAKLAEKRQDVIDELRQVVCADAIYSSMAKDFLNI